MFCFGLLFILSSVLKIILVLSSLQICLDSVSLSPVCHSTIPFWLLFFYFKENYIVTVRIKDPFFYQDFK